jgi:hypothetical protein
MNLNTFEASYHLLGNPYDIKVRRYYTSSTDRVELMIKSAYPNAKVVLRWVREEPKPRKVVKTCSYCGVSTEYYIPHHHEDVPLGTLERDSHVWKILE